MPQIQEWTTQWYVTCHMHMLYSVTFCHVTCHLYSVQMLYYGLKRLVDQVSSWLLGKLNQFWLVSLFKFLKVVNADSWKGLRYNRPRSTFIKILKWLRGFLDKCLIWLTCLSIKVSSRAVNWSQETKEFSESLEFFGFMRSFNSRKKETVA